MAKSGSQVFGFGTAGRMELIQSRSDRIGKLVVPDVRSHTPNTPMPSDTQVKKQIGQSIRAIREHAGITQELAAERSDLHPIYYGNVERGRNNISVISLAKIARALNCSVRDILAGTEL